MRKRTRTPDFAPNSKFGFWAPRFHTNQVGLVDGLLKRGFLVRYAVMTQSNSEYHGDVIPSQIPASCIYRIFAKVLGFLRVSPDPLVWFLPSIRGSVRWMRSERPDYFIIRGFLQPAPLLFLILALASKSRPILYTQGPVYRNGVPLVNKFLYLIAFSVFRLPWITPVLYRMQDGALKDLKKVDGLTWVPFATRGLADQVSATDPECIRFILISKFEPRKKILECLDAFAELPPTSMFQLTVIGETSTEERRVYLKKVLARIQDLRLEEHVRVLHDIPYESVQDHLAHNDIMVLNSKNEPASISQLEAMSMGLAVLCTSDNGTAHYIEHNANGLIFPPCHQGLSESLRHVYENSDKVSIWKERSLEKAREEFNSERISGLLLKLIGNHYYS